MKWPVEPQKCYFITQQKLYSNTLTDWGSKTQLFFPNIENYSFVVDKVYLIHLIVQCISFSAHGYMLPELTVSLPVVLFLLRRKDWGFKRHLLMRGDSPQDAALAGHLVCTLDTCCQNVIILLPGQCSEFRYRIHQAPLHANFKSFLPRQSAMGFPPSSSSRKDHVMGRDTTWASKSRERLGMSLRLEWTHSKSLYFKGICVLSLQSVSSLRLLVHTWNSTENL